MSLPYQNADLIKQELEALNSEWKDAKRCYHFQMDPPHVLFNSNCPEELENRVRSILHKYTDVNESRP